MTDHTSGSVKSRKRNPTQIIISVLLTLGMAICLTVPAAATQHESQRETVKVGFFPFEGYHEKSDDGQLSGYGYDILQQMLIYKTGSMNTSDTMREPAGKAPCRCWNPAKFCC